MGLPSARRLKRRSEYDAVRTGGRRVHSGPFILQLRISGGEASPKVGIVASRRVGNAVIRNRGKRLVRELFRRHEALLPKGGELVVVLRAGFDCRGFGELEQYFVRGCRRLAAGDAPPPEEARK